MTLRARAGASCAARPEWGPEFDFVQLDSPDGGRRPVRRRRGPWERRRLGVDRTRRRAGSASGSSCRRSGVAEDEATGSAALRLCAQLGHPIEIRQGRNSLIFARPADEEGFVEIGGRVALEETASTSAAASVTRTMFAPASDGNAPGRSRTFDTRVKRPAALTAELRGRRHRRADAPAPDGRGECAPCAISAKADYAVRAMVELAAASEEEPVQPEVVQVAQDIPPRFLATILNELSHHDLVSARRGRDGGYWLGRPADEISLARDHHRRRRAAGDASTARSPRSSTTRDRPGPLRQVWERLSADIHGLLESVTLADVVTGDVPTHEPPSTPASRSPTGRRRSRRSAP